jgi:hypothetical protein
MDHFEVKDRVRVKSEWPLIDGKEARVMKVYKYECDVKVDGRIFFVHKDRLTHLP